MINATFVRECRLLGIDAQESLRIKNLVHSHGSVTHQPVWSSVAMSDERIRDVRGLVSLPFSKKNIDYYVSRLAYFAPGVDTSFFVSFLKPAAARGFIERKELEQLGLELFPYASYGILNGGAATSYIDKTRNEEVYQEYFYTMQNFFVEQSKALIGKPKALAPAFYYPNCKPGPTFLELKLRAFDVLSKRYEKYAIEKAKSIEIDALLPWFQLVSTSGKAQIDQYCKQLHETIRNSVPHRPSLYSPLSATQNLIAALEIPKPGVHPDFFRDRDGKLLGLPAGHGQVYGCLRTVYEHLFSMGKRLVWIGNIDNLGSVPEPVHLAIMVLSGKPAAFEFSYKTSLDTKGGILVQNEQGELNCTDIGQSIDADTVKRLEQNNHPLLFNCATGLFDLSWLIENIDYIMRQLPLRISHNSKDRGRWLSIEQSAWEVLGLIDSPLILAVDKSKRFLANKFLLDSFLTSSLGDQFITNPELKKMTHIVSAALHELLEHDYAIQF